MKHIKRIVLASLVGMGAVNFCYTVLSLIMKDILNENLLYAMNLSTVTVTICSVLIFKTGVSPVEKWIRRMIVMLIGCIVCPASLFAFSWVTSDTVWRCIVACASATITFSFFAFFIGDRLEKKHFDRINKKLSENREE